MKKFFLPAFCFFFSVTYPANAQNSYHKKYLQPSLSAQLVQLDSVGNLYVCGWTDNADILLFKLDTNGDMVWDKEFGRSDRRDAPTDMIILPNQEIIITGWSDQGGASTFRQGFVMGMNSFGQTIFEKTIGDTISDLFTPSQLLVDGLGFSLCLDGNAGTVMIKFDTLGIPFHERLIDHQNGKLFKLRNNKYIYYSGGGGLVTTQVDSNFENPTSSDFSDFLNDPINTNLIINIVESINGEVYILGFSQYNFAGFIAHYNQTNYCDWKKIFFNSNHYSFKLLDMKEYPDKGWLIVGRLESMVGNSQSYIIVQTDSLFQPLSTSLLNDSLYWEDNVLTGFRAVFDRDYQVSIAANKMDALNHIGIRTDVIHTDTNFAGICNLFPTIFTTEVDSFSGPFSVGQLVVSSITSLIDSVNWPILNVSPAYGLCSDFSVLVNSISSHHPYSVFPNPSHDFINIDFEGSGILYVYDMFGKCVLSNKIINKFNKIDISQLNSGVYHYYLITSNQTYFSGGFLRE